jgi:superfamily II DNA or RNA helicase
MQEFTPHDFGLIICDEAHHATARTYRRIFDYFGRNPELKRLGVTATPDRCDEVALGKVFDTVAYHYEIPNAILDGFLVPIDQRYIVIEDLDFSAIRTTAGDLNAGDLEAVLLTEKFLHGIVNPTLELAGDRPTLVFTVSVAHAERVAEIINRHRPQQAICLHASTPSDERREMLRRFKRREVQYLVNCGLFLEGFDETSIGCVAIGRPTKSRALYAQMIGRGTRPHPPGLIDQDDYAPDDRCELIATSGKPDLLVLDFVGNSGKHKLMSSADILGGNYADEVVEKAKAKARQKAAAGQPTSMLNDLIEAQKEYEEEQKRRRRLIVAKASYRNSKVDPFDVLDVAPKREPGWHKGRLATDRQLEVLKSNGIEKAGMSFWEATQLIQQIFDRRDKGLCTFKQAKLLAKFGYSAETSFEDAKTLIDRIAANGWKRPVEASVNGPVEPALR